MATNVSGYLPNDRPGPGRLVLLGLQHVVTMFPATVLVALLCGFHPSTVLLGAGVSTIVALILSKRGIGKFIPLFYGSSFSYIAAYLGLAQAAGHKVQFGVPAPVVVSIIGIESYFGRLTGTFRTIDVMTTLSFDYLRRADFYRAEFTEFLLLAREQKRRHPAEVKRPPRAGAPPSRGPRDRDRPVRSRWR